ncbi:MAG: RluA family pseudouridine synthase [Silicimonas sp.]|nr:RluA family pseudouridine synthase [Silicimonas sp.]
MSRIVRVEIGAAPPPRLDKALARYVPEDAHLSRSRLMRLLAEGAVSRAGVLVTDAKATPTEGEIYEIAIDEAVEVETRPEAIPLSIVHEDADLIVVDKPAGMVVHPAPGTPGGTLVNALLHHFGGDLSGVGGEKRPGIVHRIDKDTSGLLVVAKSDAAHHGLATQFADHSIERRYQALCYGVPSPADPRLRGVPGVSVEPGAIIKITTMLARHRTDRQRQAVMFQGGRHAVTRMSVIETFSDHAARLECRLETGRTHQIRVHAAHIGHGLIGDPVYGGRRKLSASATGADAARTFQRQALHAATLGFRHPVSSAFLRFESAIPDDMQTLLSALRGG